MIGESHIEWTSPAPLWPLQSDFTDAPKRRAFRTPALLRFSTDDFMDEFGRILNETPETVGGLLAQPESWVKPQADTTAPPRKLGVKVRLERLRARAVKRIEQSGRVTVRTPIPARSTQTQLKLYQPAHGRYYLVSTCLVCRTPGLPDRVIDASIEEKATFVIRLLKRRAQAAEINPDPNDCDEYALVAKKWVKLDSPAELKPGEEQNPLAPLTYTAEDGRKRRILTGMVPVANREAFSQAPVTGTDDPPLDARRMRLKSRILGPWATLEEMASDAVKQATPLRVGDPFSTAVTNSANDRIQAASWFVLLDFAEFLADYVPELIAAAEAGSTTALTSQAQIDLYNLLEASKDGPTSLRYALGKIRAQKNALESSKTTYQSADRGSWPSEPLFQFARAGQGGPFLLSPQLRRCELETKLVALLPDGPVTAPVSAAAQSSAINREPMLFTIRCVLERPMCGTLAPALVSEPTASFRMAEFFDPDAPARPIRIGLPVDTSPAGLRKFDKNTAFVMSDILCGQVSKMKSLGFVDLVLSVLPFPLNKALGANLPKPCPEGGGPALGMVCSLSIPIITLCALIVLMIMVKLLDIIFFWLPFFQICLPVPKFDAKENA